MIRNRDKEKNNILLELIGIPIKVIWTNSIALEWAPAYLLNFPGSRFEFVNLDLIILQNMEKQCKKQESLIASLASISVIGNHNSFSLWKFWTSQLYDIVYLVSL